VDVNDPDGQTGPTGMTGITGPDGPRFQYDGRSMTQNLEAYNADPLDPVTQQVGVSSSHFDNIYAGYSGTTTKGTYGRTGLTPISGSKFGVIEMSNNLVLPTVYDPAHGLYIDIGSATKKFNYIYAHSKHIYSNTIVVIDPSGNVVSMSYDLVGKKTNVQVATTAGDSFQIIPITTFVGGFISPYTISYTGLTFYSKNDPSGGLYIVDDITRDILSDVSSSLVDIKQAYTGYYFITNAVGTAVIQTPILTGLGKMGNYRVTQTFDDSTATS
jgi:hypothetical protein